MLSVQNGQRVDYANGKVLVDGRQMPYDGGVFIEDEAILSGKSIRQMAAACGVVFGGRVAVVAPRMSSWTKMQIEALVDRDVVAERMFHMRFGRPSGAATYEGILAEEGREMHAAYRTAFGSAFKRDVESQWETKDNTNFVLSLANNALYALIFPRLAQMGMMMQAGFVHRADSLSLFVIPALFERRLIRCI